MIENLKIEAFLKAAKGASQKPLLEKEDETESGRRGGAVAILTFSLVEVSLFSIKCLLLTHTASRFLKH